MKEGIVRKIGLSICGIFMLTILTAGMVYALPQQPLELEGNVTKGGVAQTGATITVRLGASTTDAVIGDANASFPNPPTWGTSALTMNLGTGQNAADYWIYVKVKDPSNATDTGGASGDVVHIFVNGVEANETSTGTVTLQSGVVNKTFNLTVPASSSTTTTVASTTTTTGAVATTTTTVAATTTTTVAATTTTTVAATTTTTGAVATTTTVVGTTTTTKPPTTTTTTIFLKFDINGTGNNGDGKVSVLDALVICDIVVGKTITLPTGKSADYDGAGGVTIWDALKLATDNP